MRVISPKRLKEYAEAHADAREAMQAWLRLAKASNWRDLADVRKTYPHADLVGDKTVFNIKGNRYRLITAIHYNTGTIYVREVLTHAEYDKGA